MKKIVLLLLVATSSLSAYLQVNVEIVNNTGYSLSVKYGIVMKKIAQLLPTYLFNGATDNATLNLMPSQLSTKNDLILTSISPLGQRISIPFIAPITQEDITNNPDLSSPTKAVVRNMNFSITADASGNLQVCSS